MTYAGKVAIITGGGSGIGAGFANRLVDLGAKVVLADVNVTGAEDVAKGLNAGKPGKVAIAVKTDVTNYGSTLKAFQTAREKSFNPSGRIDYVFANAGVLDAKDYGGFHGDLETLYSQGDAGGPDLLAYKVDGEGPLITSWLALAHFRNQEPDQDGWRGKLVMAASEVASSFVPFPADPLYGAAKGSTLWLTRALAARTIKEQITVNCYAPNQVKTAIAGNYDGIYDGAEERGALTPIPFLVEKVLTTLLAPDSKLTGQALSVCVQKWGLRGHGRFFNDEAKANASAYTNFDEIFEAFKIPEGIPSVDY